MSRQFIIKLALLATALPFGTSLPAVELPPELPLWEKPPVDLIRMAHRYGVPSMRVQALYGENNLDELRDQSPFEAPDDVAPASLEGMAAARELGIKLDLPTPFQSMACDRALAGDAPWLDHLTPGARLILDELLAQRATGPNTAQPRPKTGISPCRFPWDWTTIASSGVVHGCCMGGPTLGDLNTEDWEAIWNGPRYQSFRRLAGGSVRDGGSRRGRTGDPGSKPSVLSKPFPSKMNDENAL